MVRVASGGVDRPPGATTSLGFRRDIKIFLASLVGFLIVIIASLLLYLQRFASAAEVALLQRREVVADAAVRRLEELGPNAPETLIEDRLVYIRSAYAVDYLILARPDGRRYESGDPLDDTSLYASRRTQLGQLTLHLSAGEALPTRTQLLLFSGIVLAATAGGTILLLLFLPRIVRPIEQLLNEARSVADRPAHEDEETFLLATFRSTIDTMRQQESELKRLSAIDRARVDELEAVTRTLTRSIRSGFVAISADGTVIDVNGAGRRLTGLTESLPVSGLTIDRAFGETEFARVLREAATRRKELNRFETYVATADGSSVPVELTAVPITSGEGRYLGMIATFDDLSDLRALEKRLREQQRLADLGEVAAGIAHEFRNSLSTILGYLKLSQRASSDDSVTSRIQHAEREALLLSRAVESLLTFARPLKVQSPTDVDLAAMVRRIATSLDLTAETVRLRLEPCVVSGDEALLARVVENILRNAMESVARRGDGEIEISTRCEPQPLLEVRDSGIGVDPAEVERLFLPFQSDRPDGFGMGLALTKRIVVAHGASIALDGRPGEGAVVTVRFPAPAEKAQTGTDRYVS